MKLLLQLFITLITLSLFLFGCDSIIDQDRSVDMISTDLNPSNTITMDMCKNDPGWIALGYRNLGQCLRYTQSGTGSAPTVTDIDGNVYPIVKIGNQWWMAENLKVKRYRNAEPITANLNESEWITAEYGALAIYPHSLIDGLNSEDEVVAAYGILYNWNTVNDPRRLCPVGWHVPTDDEWTALVDFLGGNDANTGGKMKSTRTEPDPHPRWHIPNAGATNESGFLGLPGGARHYDGSFQFAGGGGWWWSSITSWFRGLDHSDGNAYRYLGGSVLGLSVRCISD